MAGYRTVAMVRACLLTEDDDRELARAREVRAPAVMGRCDVLIVRTTG